MNEARAAEPADEWRADAIIGELWPLRVLAGNRWQPERALPLPSRETMAEVVVLLAAVLFPRHFGPPRILDSSDDAALANTFKTALRLLQEEVYRELYLAADGAVPAEASLKPRARAIVSEFASGLPEVRRLLNTDITAAFAGDPAVKSVDEVVLCYPGIAAIIRHRLAHALYRLGAPLLARIIAEESHSRTGIDIHPGATIGEGFFIDHGTGVVIGETAIIGRNVRLYQAVTLGAKRFEVDASGAIVKGLPRHPVVEDDVVVYAGATILGRITIGAGSTIGGNVWLTQSVDPGSNVTQAKARTESFSHGGGI
jgi:serine O-acetyltransferase